MTKEIATVEYDSDSGEYVLQFSDDMIESVGWMTLKHLSCGSLMISLLSTNRNPAERFDGPMMNLEIKNENGTRTKYHTRPLGCTRVC